MGDTNYVQGKQRDDGNNNYVQQPAINDPHLYDETLNIVQFTIFSIVGRDANRNPSQVAKRVKELVLQILLKHEIFDSLCANAKFSSTTMQSDFMAVSENIFNDGHINWGRIISLLAFGVKVSQYFRARRIENIDDVVVELTTHFLVKELGPWIRVNGGWDDVVRHFKTPTNDFSSRNSSWLKGIFTAATATIGIGAYFAITCK